MDAIPSFRWQSPVGRDEELAVARGLLAAALGGQGGVLLVGGAAGVGKTAVARALALDASAAGAQVRFGHCYDRAETPPYGPWLECFAWDGSADRAVGGELLPLDPAALPNQEAFFEQTRGRLAAIARERPTLLVLEDLHWADAASLDLLRSVSRSPYLAPMPLLLVATYRNDALGPGHPLAHVIPALVREAPTERIDLRPLDAESAAALVQARYGLPDADAERLAAYLLQRTEGNALFITELLRTLEEERVLVREEAG